MNTWVYFHNAQGNALNALGMDNVVRGKCLISVITGIGDKKVWVINIHLEVSR
jgi:hypothetical protein